MASACACDPCIPARTCSGVRPSVPNALSLPSAISSDSSAQVIGSSRTPVGRQGRQCTKGAGERRAEAVQLGISVKMIAWEAEL